jgi:ankyrin repeat protein
MKETLRLLQLRFVNLLRLLLQYDGSFARTRIGSSAFHYAVESNDFDNVELLVDSGADVNSSDCDGTEKHTVLQKAVNNHHVIIVKVILKVGADLNVISELESRTALQMAAGEPSSEIVRLLLDAGADVEQRTNPENNRTTEQQYRPQRMPVVSRWSNYFCKPAPM